MTTLKVLHKFNLLDFSKSDYPTKQFDNFGMIHLLQDKLSRCVSDQQFFIVEADAKHNYGLDFKIYTRYKADGIWFFRQFSHSSSLTSFPFKIVSSALFSDLTNEQLLIMVGALDLNFEIHIHNESFTREERGRRYFRKNSDLYTITTDF